MSHVLCLPLRGKGDRLKTVDEEKVSGKLATIKIRNDHNTSSVGRDIIDSTQLQDSLVILHKNRGKSLLNLPY